MQEEVENKTINLAISTTKLTARTVINAVRAYLQNRNRRSSCKQPIKKLSQEGQCIYEAIIDIMVEEKKAEMDRVTIKNDVLHKYFPKAYTPKQMEDTLLNFLEQWQKERQRSQER